ncbi:helix-turn-helix domain-containing protein [Nocardia wallacei]|uniref:helix-turn-helix domain-containing protein n=1 Tax=Nocardia wallacei TaxID=480035 RepID=UPI002456B1DC|nr:helix-turn-helix transcriptional regulator [Nocardia wallacei]
MSDVGAIIQARRKALGLEQPDLAARVGTTATQISRWENGKQEPTASNCRMLARALGLSTDELLGLMPVGLDLSGIWHAAWDTTRDSEPVIDRHTLEATHRGVEFTFAATGDYLWAGNLRYVDGSLMGAYLATEKDKMFRGSLYFILAEDVGAAIGRWSGLWADGLVGGGWGVLARDDRRAGRLMELVTTHDGPLTEWPNEE